MGLGGIYYIGIMHKYHHSSLYVELNKVDGDILIPSWLICTDTNLQVISSWLRKLLAEPWEVWWITACTLRLKAILSIPQCVVRVENMIPWISVKS